MTEATEELFKEEMIAVTDLVVDSRVQRQALNMAKVRKFVKRYNPSALGIVTVSRRADRSLVVVDGMHRVEATRIFTTNAGLMLCHVFTDLSLADEAQMFLDLNETTQPMVADKFNVTLSADSVEGDAARDMQELVGAYGWRISRTQANGHINCIRIATRLYELSQKLDAQPNLLQAAILVITRAWGNDRHGVQGPILEGIGRMFGEYGSNLDMTRLVDTLKAYQGGPQTLVAEAQALAAIRKGRVSMAVAEQLVESYNKGLRSGNRTLSQWRKRS